MPICIECRFPVHQLYTTYSRADDRALGRGVRLTICPRCKKFADKYVEHDFVVLFIDLVLIKPQVYRHLLFNRLGRDDDGFDPSIVRLGILLLLFDVYLTWARVEKESSQTSTTTSSNVSPFSWLLSSLTGVAATNSNSGGSSSSILNYPIPLQYMFFLCLCALETLSFHLPIRLLARRSAAGSSTTLYPSRISTALLVSSCSKLFPILMVIWDYDLPSSASAVSWAVIINNVAALQILLGCGYAQAALLAGAGAACRWAVGGAVLATAGLGHLRAAGGGGSGSFEALLADGEGGVAVAKALGREAVAWIGLV